MTPTPKQLVEYEIMMHEQFGSSREDYVEGLRFALKVMEIEENNGD